MSKNRMSVQKNSLKPNNYRSYNPGISYSNELNKLRKEQILNKQQITNSSQTSDLRKVFLQYENGSLDRDKFLNKITQDLNVRPNEELKNYLKNGNLTYTGLMRCMQNRESQQIYTPKVKSGSFTDRQFTHVDQNPAVHSKRQTNLTQMITNFHAGRISGEQFRRGLQEEEIKITPQIERVINDQIQVGVSNRDISKAVFSQIREGTNPKENPNYADPSAYQQFNVYDMKLRDIDESKKLYCETHILIHGKTGATVGKRADVLTKFYKGTPDLLEWEKENDIDEVVNPKKGAGLRQKLTPSSDVFSFNPEKNKNADNAYWQRKARGLDRKVDSGDIISWKKSNESEQISTEQYFNTKRYTFLNR